MLRLIVAELAHRRGRALALLAGIAVATASFTVLTGASESSSLEVRGTVAQHFRTNYDLLVRPQRTMTPMERGGGLVQQNFLAGIDGGITMDQWHAMRRTPGVDVAAPLAVFGYVSPVAELPIALRPHLLRGPRTAFRLGVRWISDRGTLTLRDADSYAYVTRRGFDPEGYLQYRELTHATVFETVPGQPSVPICRGSHAAASAFSRAARSYLSCSSTQNGSVYGSSATEVRDVPARIQFPIPMIIAGVDPEAEARLSGTDRAVVSGRWLRSTDKPAIRGHGVQLLSAEIPVVAASAPQLDLEADVRLYRLSAAQAQGVRSAGPDRGRMLGALRSAAGERIGTWSFSASKAYNVFLGSLRTGAPLEARWTTGPLRYRARGPRHLAALPAKTDPYNWGSTWGLTGTGTGYVAAPPSAHDTGFRTLDQHVATNDGKVGLSSLRAVGTFDPRRVPGAGDRFRGALDPFRSAAAPLVDPSLLGGQTLAPDGNLAGYLTPPPTLLTTLDARSVLLSRQRWDDVQSQQAAPISVVRVRVEGVTGPDRTSRERIRLVAQRIARETGLQVDVTAGSSPTPVRVDLPAGRDGRPALALHEGWIKKGVAVAILTAVDRKSLILFGLVLVVCALFCLNAASAAVRTRSAELGVLACVGWPARRLFLYLLTEVGIVGLAAGVLGTVVALPVGALLGLPVSGSRALVAIPAATMLALVAGLVPAARAARSDPLEAVRPAVRAVRA
ncbi:MAG: hypothetical protein JWQ20_3627, partial [Conexibacter sp.]|nr:hypothetical protein [Conexibacter sp.]